MTRVSPHIVICRVGWECHVFWMPPVDPRCSFPFWLLFNILYIHIDMCSIQNNTKAPSKRNGANIGSTADLLEALASQAHEHYSYFCDVRDVYLACSHESLLNACVVCCNGFYLSFWLGTFYRPKTCQDLPLFPGTITAAAKCRGARIARKAWRAYRNCHGGERLVGRAGHTCHPSGVMVQHTSLSRASYNISETWSPGQVLNATQVTRVENEM